MAERPPPLARLDRYFASATIAHEYVSDLHRELVALHDDDDRTRELFRESAAIVLEGMPKLTRELRRLERDWDEQTLLDPLQAGRTLRRIEITFARVEDELVELRVRQREIATALRARLDRGRRS
jgi:hypothetical protein